MTVEWRRSRFATVAHAVVNGDGLTLCGELAEEKRHIEPHPGSMACPACVEITRELSRSLVAPTPPRPSHFPETRYTDA